MIIFMILVILFLLWMVFWQGSLLIATIIGTPTVYANKIAVRDCLKLAKVKKGDLLVDLGCGNARVLIIAAREFGAKGIGVDRSLFCYLRASFNVYFSGQKDNIRIIWGDFKKAEKYLEKADAVYLYLLNVTLSKIEKWFFDSISRKTKVVSLAFVFPNHQPLREIETFNLGKKTKARLYVK